MESLEGVASLVGQLSLARRHHNGFVTRALATPTKRDVFPEINDDFLSIEVRIHHYRVFPLALLSRTSLFFFVLIFDENFFTCI